MAALGLCLAAPAAAYAATVFFQGKVEGEPNATVSFEVRGPESNGFIKLGKAKVEDVLVSGVKLIRNCPIDQGEQTTTSAFLFEEEIDVQGDGDFKAKERPAILGEDVQGNMVVKGQFKGGEQVALGSFHLQAVAPDPDHGDCTYNVAKVHWKARGIDSR